MPEGSKVEEIYKALLEAGHSKESAAKIAQWRTGTSLKTGKPPEKEENSKNKLFDGSEHVRMSEENDNAFDRGRMRAQNSLKLKYPGVF